ncbi:MAG: PD-(D/E)XK nuclease family protein [Candidatus Heimdallarchaeota archaeon]
MDYELNLSASEFLLFLECPQKFRLYRMLNPLPIKEVFMSSDRTISSYKLRGYDERLIRKIKNHKFFETFHKRYASMINDTIPPEEIVEDNVYLLYWIEQQEKYQEVSDLCYWYPAYKELQLMTKRMRGKIDYLELCENKSGLRLIDYKPAPNQNDELLLQFYARLFNNYKKENPYEEGFEYSVLEVGCYYYTMGVRNIASLTEKSTRAFEKYYKETIRKITNQEFYINKQSCWNCDYKYYCKIEQKRS